ncbi:ABC transporter permease [Cohnella laeviribosi]|uniref:ABC transporter permease n=1 Tax=Cohnella laeviribosi TaxID=380174 RepID=UPI003D220E21
MADFWKLVQNENMKIYRRPRTWIMFGFVVLVPVLISVLVAVMDGTDSMNNWELMRLESSIVFQLITVFAVVKAADSVAGEFTWGTIKLLLIRPWSRSSILLSKYISVLLFSLLFIAVCFAVTFTVNVAIFGYDASPKGLIPETSPLAGGSPWTYMGASYLLLFVSQIVIVTFGFMFSAAFRSSGLAIGLSIFLLLSGSLISGLLSLTGKAWIKFVLFPHLQLMSYLDSGTGPLPNHPTTLGFSLAVLAVYFVLFNLVSWAVFCKRDVAG